MTLTLTKRATPLPRHALPENKRPDLSGMTPAQVLKAMRADAKQIRARTKSMAHKGRGQASTPPSVDLIREAIKGGAETLDAIKIKARLSERTIRGALRALQSHGVIKKVCRTPRSCTLWVLVEGKE